MANHSKIPFNKKLFDTGRIREGGRVDEYWYIKTLDNVFKGDRKKQVPKTFKFYDPYYILDRFGLDGLEFGNWLSQEDRYIYMAGAAFAMEDYCNIMGIKRELYGLNNRITLAFGARGKNRALAHFEPWNWAINLTRHREAFDKIEGAAKYLSANGAGSLGHEHAHALDQYAGLEMDKNGPHNYASEILTERIQYVKQTPEGVNCVRILSKPTQETQKLAFDLMLNLLYVPSSLTGSNGERLWQKAPWYHELCEYVANNENLGEYWIRYVELFARSTEVYLYHKCDKANIKESFLKKRKYEGIKYPPMELIEKLEPKFNKFFKHIFKHLEANK